MPEPLNREIVIFNDALALPVDQRAAFLDEACGGDADLRRRVESLLQAHVLAGAFLEEAPQKFDSGQTSILSKAPRPQGETAPEAAVTVRYIGDYELQEEIGRGGMGVVFRARQVSLNRIVAVKMILAGEYAGPEERRRFQREAESAAQLRHANIVSIHEVGEHEGRNYYSMDFIEGRSLSAALKESKMPASAAAALVKTLAEAVHFAHQRGTLHRDLKPQNVLMGSDGQPHILDFGLARPMECDGGLTKTGDVMGSPSYMPPEQASGRIVDIGPASDVYALGAILYEAITGRPPFTGESAVDVLTQVIDHDPKPPRLLNPNVAADLETICLKCLEKRPERRYHSARALAEELERFLNFEPILARPASRARRAWNWTQRNPWVFAAGFGLATLVMFCVAYALWQQTQILHWRLEAGKEAALPSQDAFFGFNFAVPPRETAQESRPVQAESPALLFFLLFPAVCLLLYFVGRGFRSGHRKQAEGGAAVLPWTVLRHAAAGIGAAVVGMGYLLLQIRSWMWRPAPARFVLLEVAGVLCALALNWIGLRMVWEAIGIHETSRYRDLVNKTLDQQWAADGRRRLMFKLIAAAWWFYVLALVVIFIVSGSSFNEKKRELFIAITGMLISTGATALATWAVHKRRSLFIFACIPMTLAACFFAFVALTADIKVVIVFLLLYLFAVVQTLVTFPLFVTRKESTANETRQFRSKLWTDIVFGGLFAAGLFALLHLVENWRGRDAWERAQHDLAAKGVKLDWAAYIPPPVPDDQNIFKAPKMEEWFVHQGKAAPSSLSKLLEAAAPWYGSNSAVTSCPLAEIKILPLTANSTVPSGQADLVLRWKLSSLAVMLANHPGDSIITNSELLPLIAFNSVPPTAALNAVGSQAGLTIMFDPGVERNMANATMTVKWSNITVGEAMSRILETNRWRLVDDPSGSPIKRVVPIDPNDYAYYASDQVRAAFKKVMDQTLGPTMIDSTGRLVLRHPAEQMRPVRIVLLCDQPPATNDMEPLFLDYLINGSIFPESQPLVRVESNGSASMIVNAKCAGSAENYVAWSEKCEPQFEVIRQALRRPYARMEGDYQHSYELPAQNFWTMRVVVQTLGATAQAYMLRGDPERALRQLTLMHDVCRVAQGPPGGQPEILFSAMINAAITGLYVKIIHDGLRWRAWQEPQLAALEAQLEGIDLPAFLERSFRLEELLVPHALDVTPRSAMTKLVMPDTIEPEPKTSALENCRWNAFFHLAPRGWLDQNKVSLFETFEPIIDAFDLAHHGLDPRIVDEWGEARDKFNAEFNPYAAFEPIATPRANISIQTTVKNQTLADQARIACALERFRLAHHEYPQSMDQLVPRFLGQIPRDIIGGQVPLYRRNADGGFELSSAGWKENERWAWPSE